jgi:hypothetical protein
MAFSAFTSSRGRNGEDEMETPCPAALSRQTAAIFFANAERIARQSGHRVGRDRVEATPEREAETPTVGAVREVKLIQGSEEEKEEEGMEERPPEKPQGKVGKVRLRTRGSVERSKPSRRRVRLYGARSIARSKLTRSLRTEQDQRLIGDISMENGMTPREEKMAESAIELAEEIAEKPQMTTDDAETYDQLVALADDKLRKGRRRLRERRQEMPRRVMMERIGEGDPALSDQAAATGRSPASNAFDGPSVADCFQVVLCAVFVFVVLEMVLILRPRLFACGG